MNKPIDMKEFFIFTTVIDGIERIAMHPVDNVPLIYLAKQLIDGDGIREYLQSVVDAHGMSFKLKHFIFESTLECIEPMKSRLTQ
jgi:hypothetical protein